MKHPLLFVAIVAISASFFASCSGYVSKKQLQQENDSLRFAQQTLETEMNLYFSNLSSIADNLDRAKSIGGYLNDQAAEGVEHDPAKRIEENIQIVTDLIRQNNEKIAALNKSIRGSKLKVKELEKYLARLTEDNERMASDIVAMQEQLSQKNIIIAAQDSSLRELSVSHAQLSEQKQMADATMAQQDEQLHTAWYVFGTTKELKAQGIIPKSGISARSKVLRDEFNKDFFVKVDTRTTTQINLYSKRAKVLTTHPTDSYVLEKVDGQYTLRITDTEAFWSISRYLVIDVD